MSSELNEKLIETLNQAKKIIYGQDKLLEALLAALVCEGHVLIEGMPGLGKTLSVATVAKLCDLTFKRIQFTPDLLPSDLIGTMVYNQAKEEFKTKFGPIFTQLLLADEINRSPAKVQSALLEAMAEKQVTIGDESHKLTSPFVVLATQNPIEQEGTYNLPETQLDRFMMKVNVDYPAADEELKILDLKENPTRGLDPIMSTDDFLSLKEAVESVYVDDKIKTIINNIVRSTRPDDELFPKEYKGAINVGASPRASICLFKISKFFSFLNGKDFVGPEELIKIIPDVLGHRLLLTYEATVDKISPRELALTIANRHI